MATTKLESDLIKIAHIFWTLLQVQNCDISTHTYMILLKREDFLMGHLKSPNRLHTS